MENESVSAYINISETFHRYYGTDDAVAERIGIFMIRRWERWIEMADEKKLMERTILGMNRRERFTEVEHAVDAGAARKRLLAYFAQEKTRVLGMAAVVVFGTLCGVYAPSLQSNAIDIITGTKSGKLGQAILLMLFFYLLYSASQLVQGLLSAQISQRIVARMRGELFGKITDLPVSYLDTHSDSG